MDDLDCVVEEMISIEIQMKQQENRISLMGTATTDCASSCLLMFVSFPECTITTPVHCYAVQCRFPPYLDHGEDAVFA